MKATVIILPTAALNPAVTDPRRWDELGKQQLKPSSDRRNVIELWRVKIEREQAQVAAEFRASHCIARRQKEEEHGP